MQVDKTTYNPAEHDKYLAMFIRQPYATDFIRGNKSIEVRDITTSYRGDVLICSTPKYEYKDMMAGCTIGLAELYDIKPISELTKDEWKQTRVNYWRWMKMEKGFAWFFRNQRRVIELPIKKASKGHICDVYFTKDLITPYPKIVIYDV